MNRDEAKYILRSYHLNGWDAEDPQFRGALEMLRHDPELAAWFAEEQAIDSKLSEKFRALPVPADLNAHLLAARRVVPLRVWWQRPVWLGAAACIALAATLAVFLTFSPEKKQFVDFRNYVGETAARLDHLDFETTDLVRIREWLVSHKAPEDFLLPTKLNGRPSVGCRVFEWSGQKISLICFELESKKVAHLFVIDRSGLTKIRPGEIPEFQTIGKGIATASWSDVRRVYIVAMNQGEQDLKRLLL